MPGETNSSVGNTQRYIEDLKFNNIAVFIPTPLPGTKLYDDCLAKGYISKNLYEDEFITYQTTLFTQAFIETPEFNRFQANLWRHQLFIAHYKTTLRENFRDYLFSNPRAWLSMVVKVSLYKILGSALSYNFQQLIKNAVKR